jgi:hypothetical protein
MMAYVDQLRTNPNPKEVPMAQELTLDMLNTNFRDHTTRNLIVTMLLVADKMEVHPIFREVPIHVAGFSWYREAAMRLKEAEDAAAHKDQLKKALEKALREEAEQKLAVTALHMTMIAIHMKDASILQNTGFDMKQHKTYKPIGIELPGPLTKFEIRNGELPGTVVGSVNAVPGSGSTELQASDGDPTDESTWYKVLQFYKCRFQASGLPSVKKVHFRARYQNSAGTGPWTPYISLVIH